MVKSNGFITVEASGKKPSKKSLGNSGDSVNGRYRQGFYGGNTIAMLLRRGIGPVKDHYFLPLSMQADRRSTCGFEKWAW